MSQKIYFNPGTTATPTGLKAVVHQLADTQLLSGGSVTVSGATLTIAPHAVVFASGAVLVEDEDIVRTVTLGSAAKTWTIRYTYTDPATTLPTTATLALEEGEFQSSSTRAVLGWVYYPGGSVSLSSYMVVSAPRGQLTSGGRSIRQTTQNWMRILGSSLSPVVGPEYWTVSVPASSPYEVTLAASDVMLSDAAATGFVVMESDGTIVEQVATLGDLDATEDTFHFDYTTRKLTTLNPNFASATLTGIDLTKGVSGWLFKNSSGSAKTDHFATSFFAATRAPNRVYIEVFRTLGSTAPTVTPLYAIDTNGAKQSVYLTTTATSGLRTLVKAELASGTFDADRAWSIVFSIEVANGCAYYLRGVTAVTD